MIPYAASLGVLWKGVPPPLALILGDPPPPIVLLHGAFASGGQGWHRAGGTHTVPPDPMGW